MKKQALLLLSLISFNLVKGAEQEEYRSIPEASSIKEFREKTTLRGHTGGISSLSWSPDVPQLLASGSADSTVKIWNFGLEAYIKTLIGHDNRVHSVDWSSGGYKRLASGSDDKTIKIWNPDTAECIKTLTGHDGAVLSVSWSPDGSKIVSGSKDHSVKFWDVESGKCTHIWSHSSFGPFFGEVAKTVRWSPRGLHVAYGSTGGYMRILDVKKFASIYTFKRKLPFNTVRWSPDGTQLAGAVYDVVNIWDTEWARYVASFSGHDRGWLNGGDVYGISWSPDGLEIASGSDDKTIKIWDRSYKCIQTLTGHDKTVFSVSWSPDSSQIASGSNDTTIKIWERNRKAEFPEIEGTLVQEKIELDRKEEIHSEPHEVAYDESNITVPVERLRAIHVLTQELQGETQGVQEELTGYQQQFSEQLEETRIIVAQRIAAAFAAHEQRRRISQERNAAELQQLKQQLEQAQAEVRQLSDQARSNEVTQTELKEIQQKLEEATEEVGRLTAILEERRISREELGRLYDDSREAGGRLRRVNNEQARSHQATQAQLDQTEQALIRARQERDETQQKLEDAQRNTDFATQREQAMRDSQKSHDLMLQELQSQATQAEEKITRLNNELLVAQHSDSMEKEREQALADARQELAAARHIAALAYQRDEKITALQERNDATLQELEDHLRKSQAEVSRLNDELLEQQRNSDQVSQEEIKQTQDQLERAQKEFGEAIEKIAELTALLKESRGHNVTYCNCCPDWWCCNCCKKCNQPCKDASPELCSFSGVHT